MDYSDAGHDIQVTVDAHATFKGIGWTKPDKAWGSFRIYHRMPAAHGEPEKVNWGDFKVDCLTSGGPTATVTGRLVRTGGNVGSEAEARSRMASRPRSTARPTQVSESAPCPLRTPPPSQSPYRSGRSEAR
ncbi:hypothetical protein [Streptomyces sp. NPDC057301]|uniref:hypothetical protein n=1 Tax=Streptomyces sp. NPDC057301 TaxID=3346093 RepID=UPI00363FA5E3